MVTRMWCDKTDCTGEQHSGQAGRKGRRQRKQGEAILSLNDLVTVFHFLIPPRTETMFVLTSISTVNLVILLQITVSPVRFPTLVRPLNLKSYGIFFIPQNFSKLHCCFLDNCLKSIFTGNVTETLLINHDTAHILIY